MPDWAAIVSRIAKTTGRDLSNFHLSAVPGGCINATAVVQAGGQRYFVKHNSSAGVDMFAAEAEGLYALAATKTIRVPTPICSGIAGETAFLALEYLDLVTAGASTQRVLGQRLAMLHRTTWQSYGWIRNNTIGSTTQKNDCRQDWADFFRDCRLGFQLQLAGQGGYRHLETSGTKLLSLLPRFFDSYRPTPSLLHGDLWSGNVAATADGLPVIYDPAVYFGDRETDLAMTELFGRFPESFYRAYNETWPLEAGYKTRKVLYNLYHVLNHLNLFGGGYLSQADQMIGRLLAEVQ